MTRPQGAIMTCLHELYVLFYDRAQVAFREAEPAALDNSGMRPSSSREGLGRSRSRRWMMWSSASHDIRTPSSASCTRYQTARGERREENAAHAEPGAGSPPPS